MSRNRTQHLVETGFGIALLLTIVIAGFGQAVLQLWNWLMPRLFGLPPLTFWQAVGLMGLCWILFGGLRGFGMLSRPYRPASDRLTPEELARFRRGVSSGREANLEGSASTQ